MSYLQERMKRRRREQFRRDFGAYVLIVVSVLLAALYAAIPLIVAGRGAHL